MGDIFMKKNPLEIQYLNAADLQTRPFDKVILPLGSLESHGRHLPFGTDTLTAHLLAIEIATHVPKTAVLPPIYYGVSEHHKEFPFTISIKYETKIALLLDILEEVYREGMRKVFIMNGHDGNIAPIDAAGRTIKAIHPDIKIISLNAWWTTLLDLLPSDFFEVWNGLGHGGEGETSMGLALFPELCDISKASGIVPNLPPYVDIKWNFSELTNTGATGDPTKATIEKGLKMKEILIKAIVKVLIDLENNNWDYRSEEVKMG